MRRFCTLFLLAIALLLGASATLTATVTVVVGPATCQPRYAHFSTIQSAVNAVPTGSKIMVCPGTYPGQVVITAPLTLEGVTDGTGDAAVISVPGGGLVVNATTALFGPVTAQLLVENTVEVTVNNIVVDGTGSTCVAGANRALGVLFLNIGTSVDGTSAGKIENAVVRNQRNGCGEGILAENSFITIASNEVHDIDLTPIQSNSGQTNIISNKVQNGGNGIVVNNATTKTTVSSNAISNVSSDLGFEGIGLWVNGGAATVSKNTVSLGNLGQFAIGAYLFFAGTGTAVTGNTVDAFYYGVYLAGATGNSVQTNTISNTSSDGMVDTTSGGGNILTKNTVNEAAFGIFTDSTVGGDTLTPNTFYNVVVTIDPGPLNNPGTPVN
jgi:parallel beta-helix repeat protein